MTTDAQIEDACKQLLAKYLENSGYVETLKAFEAEALVLPTQRLLPVELQQLVQAYLEQEELAQHLESSHISDAIASSDDFDWFSDITCSLPHRVTQSLNDVHLTGILSVEYCKLPRRTFDTSSASYRSDDIQCIVTSAVDKRILFTNIQSFQQEDAFEPVNAATLAVRLNPRYPYLMLSGAMDGSCTITNLLTRQSVIVRDHAKYVVSVAWSANGRWFASAGYDKQIRVYEAIVQTHPTSSDAGILDDDVYANIPDFTYTHRWSKQMQSNPETCVFLPDSTHLAFCRRDDNHLHYVKMPSSRSTEKSDFEITSYNLNENLDSHISFCVLNLAIHPSKKAISLQTDTATSRIIVLPFHSNERLRETLYTSSEQSDFSNPRHSWLPDGTGVAVSSDDGIVRIVDLNGKVKASYGAHGVAVPAGNENISSDVLRSRYQSERGSSVIRDLCVLPDNTIVSVGLDKIVRIARPI